MYRRLGNLESHKDRDNPVLRTPKGHAFEVSYLAAYVWKKLDGKTSLNQVMQEVSDIGDISADEITEQVNDIIFELQKIGLVERRDHTLSS